MLVRLLAAFTLSAPLFATSAPDWTEPFGGPGHRSSVPGVRAPLTAPKEVWSLDLGELLGEPVISAGTVYAAALTKKGARLHAIDLATGEILDAEKIAAESYGHVSVFGSAVVVVTDAAHYYFEDRGGKFKRGKVVRETFTSPATLLPGLSLVTTNDQLVVMSLRSGKVLFEAPSDSVKPLVIEGADPVQVVTTRTLQRDDGLFGYVDTLQIGGLGTSTPTFQAFPEGGSGKYLADDGDQAARLMQISPGARPLALLAAARSPVRASRGDPRPFFFAGGAGSMRLPAVAEDPVMLGSDMYGRLDDGMVVHATLDGAGTGLIDDETRPDGAEDGPITSAGGVLILGNWAYEVSSRRILWVAPDMDFMGPLIPAADGTLIYAKDEGTLVCARDSSAAAAPAAEVRPAVPTSFEAAGEDSFSLVEQGIAGLDYAFAEDLSDVFATYSKRRLLEEARRVLEEAKERGLPGSDAAALAAKLSGKSESRAGNRDRQLAAAQKTEVEAREKAGRRALEFAGRCAEAGFQLEAASLLAHVQTYFSAGPTSGRAMPDELRELVAEASLACMPEEFPFRSSPKATELWLAWAHELAPAGAWFVDPESILASERGPAIDGQPRPEVKDSAIWRTKTIGLRTRNLAVLSRSSDPKIIGACLRNGEGTVRTLEKLLENAPQDDDVPLEVRIHASRKDYLAEDIGVGEPVPQWSAGFYAPWLLASRFHVPDKDGALNQGRALHEVVAHELTHQYIAERWREVSGGKRTPATPGYWIVEGFARFIEDQSLEIGRRGDALNDHTVQSVESAAALFQSGGGIAFKSLVAMDQMNFHRLPDSELGSVTLKSTLIGLTHTARSAFYDQAAALTFFLANRCGPEGRGRLLDLLRDHYRGETSLTPWKGLGFKTRARLERALGEFLANPAGGHVNDPLEGK